MICDNNSPIIVRDRTNYIVHMYSRFLKFNARGTCIRDISYITELTLVQDAFYIS